MYTQDSAAYSSVRNLVKANNLPVSKVIQLFHSKPSYTKFALSTGNFKTMETLATFKNEICCVSLPYVDKLAKDKNGVKYLLNRQEPV